MGLASQKRIMLLKDADVIHAVFETKQYVKALGFTKVDQHMIATAVSELTKNVLKYAQEGEVTLNTLDKDLKKGIEVIVKDNGPGILNLEKALEDNFSTGGTLGIGLPGTKRIMDEFIINTNSSQGTEIKTRKWIR